MMRKELRLQLNLKDSFDAVLYNLRGINNHIIGKSLNSLVRFRLKRTFFTWRSDYVSFPSRANKYNKD